MSAGLRTSTVRTLAVLFLATAIHVLALSLEKPLTLLLPLWALLLVAVVARSRRLALRLVALNLAIVCAVLAVTETTFWLSGRRAAASHFTQTSSHDYKIRHDVLGWAPYPCNRREVSKSYDGDELYNTTYTIDDLGLRIAPPESPDGVVGTVLFFGGSFTFGEGVADEETLPYRTGVLTEGRWRVRNLGFHGYGPQQMLAALESDLVRPLVDQERPIVAVYQGALFHARRAAGRVSWRAFMPRYTLGPDGRPHSDGFFPEGPASGSLTTRLLARSALLNRFFGEGRAGTFREIELMVAVIAASRDALQRDFPGAQLHVLYWDDASRWHDRRVFSGLEARDIATHPVSAVVPPKDLAYRLSPHDRHPNAAAHNALAEYIANSILAGQQ